MSDTAQFDPAPILKYLSLPASHDPSPTEQPLIFLRHNLPLLPSSLASRFSFITPQDRAILPLIRNRRLAYAQSVPEPKQLTWTHAARNEPALWTAFGGHKLGIEVGRAGQEEAREEREWAKREFIGRLGPEGAGMIGDLGKLLGGYEEERVGEIVRDERRARVQQHAQEDESMGDEEPDDDMEDMEEVESSDEDALDVEEVKRAFERAVRERYVAGLLDWAEYDADWDDVWDVEVGREREDEWFDEDGDEDRVDERQQPGELDY